MSENNQGQKKGMKVVILPKDGKPGEYKMIKMPLAKNIEGSKPYILQDETLYELKEINGNNPHLNQPNRPQLLNGDGVKSWIFEGTPGYVVQSGNLIVASKYNMTYLLISVVYLQIDNFNQRFIALDDLLDKLASSYGDWINEIPNTLYEKSLAKVFEVVDQDDEKYYKFSLEKANDFIQSRIDSLLEFLSTKPSSMSNFVKSKLSDPSTGTIQQDLLKLAILHHSVEFVTNSYCLPQFKDQYISSRKFDFKPFDDFRKKLKEDQKSRDLVEEGVTNIAIANKNVKKKDVPVKKTTKKQVKKVAVGKGALDGFFGKK